MTSERAAKEFDLGPNGALMWSMGFIAHNTQYLVDLIKEAKNLHMNPYIIIDMPGQVELYIHSEHINKIVLALQKAFNMNLTCVHLLDSVQACEAPNFIGGVLTSLTSQMHLEMPHVNVLTKMDQVKHYYQSMDFKLEFYLGVENLKKLLIKGDVELGAAEEILMKEQEAA